MKIFATLACCVLFSCHYIERTKDELSYKSVTGRTGTVKTQIAGQLLEYKNATVIYPETNSSIILITTDSGMDVYIQGPAVIEFNK